MTTRPNFSASSVLASCLVLGLCASQLFLTPALAQSDGTANPPTVAAAAPASQPTTQPLPNGFRYVPQIHRIAPGGTRWGMGARSAESPNSAAVTVLSPVLPGLSLSQSPTLYWMTNGGPDLPYRLTITGTDDDSPLVENIKLTRSPGLYQTVNLSDLHLSLERGKTYRWSVFILQNPERPEKNPFASGGITVATNDEFHAAQSAATGFERAAELAGNGYWYDLLDILIPAANTPNADPRLRDALNSTFASEKLKAPPTAAP